MYDQSGEKIEELIALWKKSVFDLPIESAVEHAEQIGLFLCANSLGIYSLNDIELYLIDAIYPLVPPELRQQKIEDRDQFQHLFIATELYLTGGHSRLMERLALFLDSKASLFLTKIPCETILEREESYFINVDYYHSENGSVINKIFSILDVILKYNMVILNTHPEDIYAVIASGLAKKINGKIKFHFINHADHLFSYGSTVADIWYEISAYGRYIDKKRELKARKCFLGIPISGIDKFKAPDCQFKDGDLIISAGSNVKYKPRDNISIIKLVNLLLDTYKNSKMQVIGVQPFKDYWWWLSKLKYRKRLKLSKLLSYSDYLNTTKSAKLYVDSHPMPGGTAFTEQLMQGRLCVGLNSIFKGYTPAEILKVETEGLIIEQIEHASKIDFSLIREVLYEVHGYENVKKRFLCALYSNNNSKFSFWDGCENIHAIKVTKIRHIPSGFRFHECKILYLVYRLSGFIPLLIYIAKRFIIHIR